MKSLFVAIEVNLVLWVAALFTTHASPVSVAGFLVAAVVQHWAYVRIYRGTPDRRAGG